MSFDVFLLAFESRDLSQADKSIYYKSVYFPKLSDEVAELQFRFSSVSARKLKCPSSARLGTLIARLGSSRKIPARAHHYSK